MSSENNVNLTEEQAANAAQTTPVAEEETKNFVAGLESESSEYEDMEEETKDFARASNRKAPNPRT